MSLGQFIVGFVLIAAAGMAIFVMAFGFERVWTLFGPADLGPVQFETLTRRSSPSDALACAPEICPAEADVLPPVYPLSVPELRKAFVRALATERRLTLVDIDDRAATERYIQRSERLRFPDTIVVRFVPLGETRSTVAIYSRSQLGYNDLGVNLARIERWLDKLSREAAAIRARPPSQAAR